MKWLMIPVFTILSGGSSAYPGPGDILISEILFNPPSGGVDFVEIYNVSNHPIDLQEIFIGSVNRDGQISNSWPLTTTRYLMQPRQYLVLTTRPDLITAHYPRANVQAILAVQRLPAFANQEGTVLLLYRPNHPLGPHAPLQVMDSLYYHAGMHSPFLKNVKGISLERRDMQIGTNVAGNFGSAALAAGATPGYENSSYLQTTNSIQLSSRIVSPDLSGMAEGSLELHYRFSRQDLMATVRIYNARGIPVATLMQHQSIPTHGQWSWDGRNAQGQPVGEGIYTVAIELYDAFGYQRIYRKSFVVAHRN